MLTTGGSAMNRTYTYPRINIFASVSWKQFAKLISLHDRHVMYSINSHESCFASDVVHPYYDGK